MRILVVLALLLTALVAGGLLAAPRVVDWDDYRGALTQRAEALTGGTVSIAGPIALRFLPRPTLVLAATTVIPNAGTADGTVLAVDRLDVQLKPLALLRGAPEIAEVRLVRPVLHLERAHGDASAELALLGALPFERLSVIDGRAVVRWAGTPRLRELQEIYLDATNPGPGRPIEVTGRFVVGERTFDLGLRLGRVATRTSTTLQLQLASPSSEGAPTRLGISGVVAPEGEGYRLVGELTLSGGTARGALAAASALLGQGPPPLPIGLDHDFALSGRFELASQALRIDQLQLRLADTEARGAMRLALAPVPDLRLDLQLPTLTLADAGAPDAGGLDVEGLGEAALGALSALPDLPPGRVDLAIGTLTYAGEAVRRIRLTLALDGADGIRVEQARAVLPGQTDVSFAGTVATAGPSPALHGELTAVTHDLRRLLGWLGLNPAEIAEGRLQTLSLASQVGGDPDALRLTELDLRIDASHTTGSLALSLNPHRQIAGVLAVDRLDLDAYGADAGLHALVAALREHLSAFDVALEAQIARLVWHGLRLQDVALDGRSVDGQLELRRLAIGEVAAARAMLSGTADLRAGTFELSGELVAPKPARLLRQLGFEPPLVLARLTPVTMSVVASGDGTEFELGLTVQHDQARVTLTGPVTWPADGAPRYALDVEATHPDYVALLEQLGARPPALEPGLPAALSVAGKWRATPEVDHGVVGNVRLGPMSLTGGVTWQDRAGRPLINARVSLGEVHEGTLISILGLFGRPLDPAGFDRGFLGNWPDEPLPLAWLGRFDGALELFAKGGLADQGVEVAVRLDDRRLLLDRLAARLGGAQLELQASFDTRRSLPFLALAVDLRGVEAPRLAGWLGLPAALEGTVDLYAEGTSAGHSARDLVRGLIGHADLGMGSGRLVGPGLERVAGVQARPTDDGPSDGLSLGIRAAHAAEPVLPFAALRGRFDIARGIATAGPVALDLDTGGGELSGALDLLLWAADLELRIAPAEGQPFRLRIVGPLDRPQTRVLEAPAPVDQPPPPLQAP